MQNPTSASGFERSALDLRNMLISRLPFGHNDDYK
jgi:hypothetical protein